MKQSKLQFVALCCLMGILWFGLRPKPVTQYVDNFDKYLHLAAFFSLSFLFSFAYSRRNQWVLGLGIILVGGLIEIAQDLFLPDRTFDYLELLMNSVGAFLGVSVAVIVKNMVRTSGQIHR